MPRAKALVVDHDPSVRAALAVPLRRLGAAGVEASQATKPDVDALDLIAVGLDGDTTALPAWCRDAPAYVLVVASDVGDVDGLIGAGADDLLERPPGEAACALAVRRALRGEG